MVELRNLSRLIGMRGAKADVEAFDGTLEEIAFAYAEDTDEIGIYTNGNWEWKGAASSSQGRAQLHGLARWNGASGQSTFELPDVWEYVDSVMNNGAEIDPSAYSLSSDRTQIVLDTALGSAATITAHGVVAQIG